MNQKVYSIYDTKGEFYTRPFYCKTAGEAERIFQQLVNDEKSTIFQFPTDFDLFFLGEFDEISGKLIPETTPEHVVKALHVKQGYQAPNRSERRATKLKVKKS